MENRNLGLGKFLISLPVVLGAVALPAGILVLFYLIFTDFYQRGFLTGLLQGLICLVIMFIHFIVGLVFAEKYWTARNEGLDGKIVIRQFLIYLAIGVLVQISLNIIFENPFKDPPAPSFF
ncbi:hypothetical protein PBOR_09755 [Paenibacillus borealis]|uniref:Uncharacterized protein n=2 Tax=Paenibacillus borealis TaxID=160799 RepID=A0A089L8P4_PAEBO|nr:hypothetical protein PBOR_09755 [Paenibacillus borealis]